MPQKKDWKEWLGFDSARGKDASGDAQAGAGKERRGGTSGSGRLRPTAAIAVAIAVGLLVWLLLIKGGGDDSNPESNQASSQPKAVSVVPQSKLLGALKGTGYPIYWAGPRVEVEYEVSRPAQDRTFIRYLPKGEEAETERAFLTVGSYQQSGALARIKELGQKPGAILVQVAGGGAAYAEGPDATSAYLAFPGVDTQIEVFEPEGGQALKLIRSGAIVPVG